MLDNLKYKYKALDAFGKLIVVNCIVFILDNLLPKLTSYLILPADIGDFLLQPWSVFSYGFVHGGLWHLFFNMWFLFYLSKLATNLFKERLVLNIFFLGIISGAFLYLFLVNTWSTSPFNVGKSYVQGASGGVAALLLFIATYLPSKELRLLNMFNIKWKHIGLFFIIKDSFMLFTGVNQGGYIVHIGGYLLGYYYAKQLQNGIDIGLGFQRLIDTFVSWFSSKKTLKTVYRSNSKKQPKASGTTSKFNITTQEKIDDILDKISKSGYESLTKSEKEFLFKANK